MNNVWEAMVEKLNRIDSGRMYARVHNWQQDDDDGHQSDFDPGWQQDDIENWEKDNFDKVYDFPYAFNKWVLGAFGDYEAFINDAYKDDFEDEVPEVLLSILKDIGYRHLSKKDKDLYSALKNEWADEQDLYNLSLKYVGYISCEYFNTEILEDYIVWMERKEAIQTIKELLPGYVFGEYPNKWWLNIDPELRHRWNLILKKMEIQDQKDKEMVDEWERIQELNEVREKLKQAKGA